MRVSMISAYLDLLVNRRLLQETGGRRLRARHVDERLATSDFVQGHQPCPRPLIIGRTFCNKNIILRLIYNNIIFLSE